MATATQKSRAAGQSAGRARPSRDEATLARIDRRGDDRPVDLFVIAPPEQHTSSPR